MLVESLEPVEISQRTGKPKRKAPPHAFTKEMAKEMAAKAHKARRANQEARDANLSEQAKPEPALQIANVVAKPQITPLSFNVSRAKRIQTMIDETMADYRAAESPRDKQALAMALDRLYGTWADLTGFERRGIAKARKPRDTPRQSQQFSPADDDPA